MKTKNTKYILITEDMFRAILSVSSVLIFLIGLDVYIGNSTEVKVLLRSFSPYTVYLFCYVFPLSLVYIYHSSVLRIPCYLIMDIHLSFWTYIVFSPYQHSIGTLGMFFALIWVLTRRKRNFIRIDVDAYFEGIK